MDIKKKYSWSKDGNVYTIYGVPVFEEFEDEERGVFDGDRLRAFVEGFYAYANQGWYPTLHVGHHVGMEDKENVGYIENPQLRDGVLYFDLTEIPQEIFQKVQEKKFNGVSIQKHPSEDRIMSVALLSSQEPFHKFPILVLEENSTSPTNYQIFLKRKRAMPVAETTDSQKAGINPDDEKDKKYQKNDDDDDNDDDNYEESDIKSMLQKMSIVLKEIHSMLQAAPKPENMQEDEDKKSEDMQAEQDSNGRKKRIPKDSDSVAYQVLAKRLERLESKEACEKWQSRLRAVCEKRGDLDFGSLSKNLDKFDSVSAKEAFMGILDAGFASDSYSVATRINGSNLPDFSLLSKYEGKSTRIREIARRASQDWCDTVNQSDRRAASNFQSIWKDADSFVKAAIEGEDSCPGYYDRVMFTS